MKKLIIIVIFLFSTVCFSGNTPSQENKDQNPNANQQKSAVMVKKSKNGVCHSPDKKYSARHKDVTYYKTMQECLADGGRLPKI